MNETVEPNFFSTIIKAHGTRNSPREEMNARNFLAELKRRHVCRVVIAYGVVAWLLIQISTQVFPFFEIPNWIVRLVVLAAVLGFPIALIIAWAFEMTPEGLKRADKIRPNEYMPRWSA